MDWQPLIDAGAALLGSTLVLVLLALTWIVALFGRSRVAGWLEALGWNGDALEAEAFGWLAVRHLKGLPLSWPETTGVPVPTPGGRLARP